MKFIIFIIFIMIAVAMTAEKKCSPLGEYLSISIAFICIYYTKDHFPHYKDRRRKKKYQIRIKKLQIHVFYSVYNSYKLIKTY